MPGLFFNGLIDGQRRFLNCFELTKVALIIQVAMIVIHVLGCWVFLKHYNLGIQGIGYANSVSCFTTYLIYLGYTACLKGEIKEAV
jgi:Na+-driven multidrug efflux pump